MSFKAVFVGSISGVLIAGAASAAPMGTGGIGYALGDNGSTLVKFADVGMPGLGSGTPLTDSTGNTVPLSALAYRPRTREFFGYRNNGDIVYNVDVSTGVVTPVASTADGVDVENIGFDFNNQIDAARVVSTAEDNLVFFPNNAPPNVARFNDLFYGMGDQNFGEDPDVFANAYTNAVPFTPSTQQFVLDANQDTLSTLANNAGTLTTIGMLAVGGTPIDFTETGGLDILSFAQGDNTAFALLTTAAGQGIYQLALTAGIDGFVDAKFLGATTTAFGPLDSLAVAPVPLPPSLALLGAALFGFGVVGRRRRPEVRTVEV